VTVFPTFRKFLVARRSTLTNLDSRFATALSFAAELHRDHYRKETPIPYVSHLLAVASLALEHGADQDEAIAALLHDAQEDRGGTKTTATIAILYGDRVAEIVRGCSDSEESENKSAWKERKEAYLEHLENASTSVRLVSACDKLHNARAILADLRVVGNDLWSRFSGGREGSLWYYHSLVKEFKTGGPNELAAELDRVVGEIERLVDKGGQPAPR
jgi:(p)ppGpp synthase/HD superfamily hydrolase